MDKTKQATTQATDKAKELGKSITSK